MYGHHIKTLRVVRLTNTADVTEEWTKTGDQLERWWRTRLDMTAQEQDRIEFVADVDGYYSGDIGLDSIELKQGSC